MKAVKEACQLQPKALNISVADQVEKLDEIINNTNADDYFNKTFITHGMHELITQGIARLAGKSNNAIFHLKQAMGGGKTHILIAFGLLAKNPKLRQQKTADISYQQDFTTAKIVAFNGRNQPDHYLWGEIASQLGKAQQFKQYWEGGAKAPDETAWLKLFTGDEPILIMLDELPPYFNYYATQKLGNGTIADVTTTAFANMLTAVQKKANICVVVSDLEAAYDTGSNLINKALKNATSELGRAEVAITPVNLESNEVYDILKTCLFKTLPTTAEIRTIATEYAESLFAVSTSFNNIICSVNNM
jgi:predicted AAA+ superfamily ATPase